nr:immunoglobulin light chain junction region [Mus musculus]
CQQGNTLPPFTF